MKHIHNYQIVGDNDEAMVEICKECKKKLVTRKNNGRINNKEYLKEHARDTAQPKGKTQKIFNRFYKLENKRFVPREITPTEAWNNIKDKI